MATSGCAGHPARPLCMKYARFRIRIRVFRVCMKYAGFRMTTVHEICTFSHPISVYCRNRNKLLWFPDGDQASTSPSKRGEFVTSNSPRGKEFCWATTIKARWASPSNPEGGSSGYPRTTIGAGSANSEPNPPPPFLRTTKTRGGGLNF